LPHALIEELEAGTVKVPGAPELAAPLLELVGLAVGLLELVAALLLVLVLALVAELDGAVEEPPLLATELAGLVAWGPELACGVEEDEQACRAHMPAMAADPASIDVRRSMSRCIPPLTRQDPPRRETFS
jgi:hypothetical protein